MADCAPLDPTCAVQDFLSSTIGDALSKLGDAVLDAVGKAVASLGTVWVGVGTPDLTGGGGSSVAPGAHAGGTAGIETVLGYATWIAFGVCVLALIVAATRLAVSGPEQAHQHGQRIGMVLGAVILVSGASGVVLALMGPAASTGSPAVAFLQNSLWWYAAALAMLGVIVGGIRMVWAERAAPAKDLVGGLLTLVVVTGAGVTVTSLLTAAADSFSVWILNGALDCQLNTPGGTCFGGTILTLLSLTSSPATGGLGVVLTILLGVIAVLGALIQILLMVMRGGMLVLLTGFLPVAAAAALTDPNRQMLRKTIAWLIAFIAYKPAAAIVYATAFKLVGADVFGDDGLITVITGLTMMIMALIALPALMRLIVPAIGAMSAGAGMAPMALAGAAAVLPTGAAAAGKLSSGTDSQAGTPGGSGSSGGSGPSGSAGPGATGAGPAGGTGSSGTSGGGGTGPAGTGGGTGPGGTSGTSGSSGSSGGSGPSGATRSGSTGAAGSSGAVGATGAGSAGATGSAGASGAGAAGSGAATAAAAGPAAPAVGAAQVAQGAASAVTTAAGAAASATESSTSEGGPHGSQ